VTFSTVALDPLTGDLRITVASKFLAVGAVVPFARAGVGAIATQAHANTRYGPRELVRLAPKLIREIRSRLGLAATAVWDSQARAALSAWAGIENLEERLRDDETIDPIVLRMLRERT
jgi:uncharacterized Ntn-hydrolase superfamily protein